VTSLAVGLDLGKLQDFSALAVVERVLVLPPGWSAAQYSWLVDGVEYARRAQDRGRWNSLQAQMPELASEWHVRHLQRWEIGTPYHAVVADVCRLMTAEQLAGGWLYVDETGVGSGVMELFTQAYLMRRLGGNPPVGVTITGGQAASGWNVPKRDLVSAVQVPLQQGRLRVAAGLALGDVLERELTSFRMRLSQAGHDTYDVQRRDGEGHGDLVIALCLAVYGSAAVSSPRVIESAPA
jgi:hypothetical protein